MWETIFGGISGLLGSALTSIMNYKVQKLKNEHDREMAKIEIQKMDKEKEIMIAEAEANIKITEVQTEAQMELADADIYLETIKSSQQEFLSDKIHAKLFEYGVFGKIIGVILAFLLGIVDFIKRLIRPGLTLYLVGLTTWITLIARDIIIQANGKDLTALQAKGIFENVTTIVIYLTVTCVTWWFGDRRMAKFLMRLNDGNIKNQAGLNTTK